MPVALDAQSPAARAAAGEPVGGSRSNIRLTINGAERRLEVADHWTLVEVLREILGLKRSQVELIAGQTSRDKRFLIRGLSCEELREKLPSE